MQRLIFPCVLMIVGWAGGVLVHAEEPSDGRDQAGDGFLIQAEDLSDLADHFELVGGEVFIISRQFNLGQAISRVVEEIQMEEGDPGALASLVRAEENERERLLGDLERFTVHIRDRIVATEIDDEGRVIEWRFADERAIPEMWVAPEESEMTRRIGISVRDWRSPTERKNGDQEQRVTWVLEWEFHSGHGIVIGPMTKATGLHVPLIETFSSRPRAGDRLRPALRDNGGEDIDALNLPAQ